VETGHKNVDHRGDNNGAFSRDRFTQNMKRLLSALGHQEWLRFGLRDRIIRYFHDPDSSQDEAFECEFFGCKYPGNFNTFLDWSVYYYGAYAKAELICMREFLEPLKDPVVVDVGANIGHHTLFASTIAKHVHSFEPFPPVLEKLREKIRVNKLENISVYDVGLGDSKKTLSYALPTTNNTGTGTFSESCESEKSVKLEVRAADELFETVGIKHIDYLKVDIEGFEIYALTGMRETLRKLRPICFVEWSQGSREKTMKNGVHLFPQNYNFYRFVPDEPFLVFFKAKSYRLESFGQEWTDGNLLAVPKEYAEQVDALKPQAAVAQRLRGE